MIKLMIKMIKLRPILLLTFFLFRISSADTGYLKFCGGENKNQVTSNSCSKGLWLQKSVNPGCVCAKGVWALSNGLCDRQSAIIVGDDHCFHVGFDVRVVKFIGNINDPFASSTYTAPASLDSIFEVPPTGLSPDLTTSDPTMLISINPVSPVARGDNLLCVKIDEKHKAQPVHIHINPPRSPSTKWTFDSQNVCNDATHYKYRLDYGDMYQDNKVTTRAVIGRECLDQCPNAEENRLPRATGVSQINQTMTNPSGRQTQSGRSMIGSLPGPKNDFQKTANEAPLNPIKDAEFKREKVTINLDDYHKEVNEQTIRMMHAHITPTLLGLESDPMKNYSREFEYFQTASEVATVLCPEEYVPKNLIAGLMRMFKQLLRESIDQRPQEEAPSDEQFDRIMGVLDACKETLQHENDTSQQLKFEYLNYTGFYNFTGSPGPSDPLYPKTEQCPEPLIFAVHGRKINGSTFNLKNAPANFNSWMKFNVETLDFVIETAWKMVIIGHYHCSSLFNETTASDFSTFFHQMELFFNDKVIKRWYNQVNVANTYRILKLIFPTYNLKKVAFGLDLCILGAEQFSFGFAYNAKWIQRPKIPFTDNDLSQGKYWVPGPGNGTALSTNDYAPAILPNRAKRAAGGSSLWGGEAKCMDSFSDPVNVFGYTVKPGCNVQN